jgi:hypothetical protein
VWTPIIGGNGAEPCPKNGWHQKAEGTEKQLPRSQKAIEWHQNAGQKGGWHQCSGNALAKKVGGTNAAAPMLR